MEQNEVYQFSNIEKEVLMSALAMYRAYMEHEASAIVGDESDEVKENVRDHYSKSQEMALHFFNEQADWDWEQESAQFAQIHGRPMDWSDVSKFDFHEYYIGE